ncbi:MAG: sugar-binding protein [Arachnia sp.]
MADPLITLSAEGARVQPGAQARIEVAVTNLGDRVEGYRFQVLGAAAAWATVVPPEVSVYPRQKETVTVVLAPPAGTSVPAGVHPFGVMARSTLDPAVSAVAEGDVEVTGAVEVQATLIPVNSSGRLGGQHRVELSNVGNATADLRISAVDPDETLTFHVGPTTVSLPPGGKTTVRLLAKPNQLMVRGTPVRKPFKVTVAPLPIPALDGAFNQKPILTNLVITLVTAALALTVGGVVFAQRAAQQGPVAAVPLAPRSAPDKLTLTLAEATATSAEVRWESVEGANSYEIQRVDCETSGGFGESITEPDTVNRTVIPDLPSAATVCARGRAVGDSPGAWSDVLTFETEKAPGPKSLARPKLSVKSAKTTSIVLSWASITGAANYEIQQVDCADGGGTSNQKTEAGTVNQTTFDGFTPSTTYCFRMRAKGAPDSNVTDSKWSAVLKAKTAVELPPVTEKLPMKAYYGTAWIDGDMSDWDGIDYVGNFDGKPISGDTDSFGYVRFMWDDEALYLSAEVRDRDMTEPDRKKPEAIWKGDSIILELGDNNEGMKPEELARPTDAYYMFGYAPDAPAVGVLGPTKARTSFDVLRSQGTIEARSTIRQYDGEMRYVIEAKIPWTETKLGAPYANRKLAVNVNLADRGHGMKSTNEQRTVDLRAHPAYWQTLVLG